LLEQVYYKVARSVKCFGFPGGLYACGRAAIHPHV
jgi:hypothetical protein